MKIYRAVSQNVGMLAGLRHDALVGGDDDEGGIDAAHPGQHVLNEVDVPRHVDQSERLAVGEFHPGEAEVDGHLALALLLEPVGVDAGQGPDERRFAVVDVAGGGDGTHLFNQIRIGRRLGFLLLRVDLLALPAGKLDIGGDIDPGRVQQLV